MPHFNDRCRPPFRTHPQHGRVFAPWDVFGTQYAITDEAQYKALQSRFSPKRWTSYVYPLYFLIALQHLRWVWQIFAVTGLFLTLEVSHPLCFVKRAVRGLMIAEPRLPFVQALVRFVREQSPIVLWTANLLVIAVASVLAYLANTSPPHLPGLWLLISLFVALALLFSVLIGLRQTQGATSSRQPVRR